MQLSLNIQLIRIAMKSEIDIPDGFEIAKIYLRRIDTVKPMQRIKFQTLKSNGNYAPVMDTRLAEAETWDWGKSSHELAEEHNLGYSTVNLYRKVLGKPKSLKYYPACLSWNWDKSNTSLSREIGVNSTYIRRLRVAHGSPATELEREFQGIGSPKYAGINYEKIDWTKTDSEIAREIGRTRESVRQNRVVRNKPKAYSWMKKLANFQEVFKGFQELSMKQANTKLKIDLFTLKRYCHNSGIKWVADRKQTSKYPWDKINWDLSDSVLVSIWGFVSSACSVHRFNNNRQKAKFHGSKVPDEFQSAYQTELKLKEEFDSNQIKPTPDIDTQPDP